MSKQFTEQQAIEEREKYATAFDNTVTMVNCCLVKRPRAWNPFTREAKEIKPSTDSVCFHYTDYRFSLWRGKVYSRDCRLILRIQRQSLLYQTKDHIRLDFGWETVAKCFFSYRSEVAVPDIRQIKLQTGDRVLLCSDGLYKSMAPDILQARMMDDKPLEEILDVYDFLCEKQGDDNYTAILIECVWVYRQEIYHNK